MLVCTFWDYAEVNHLSLHRIRAARSMQKRVTSPRGFTLDEHIRSGKLGFLVGPPLTLKARVQVAIAERLEDIAVSSQHRRQPRLRLLSLRTSELLGRAHAAPRARLRIWERRCRAHPDEPLPPIVVSHDPKGWRAPCEFSDLLSPVMRQHELLLAVTPHFRCIVDDLSRLSDQDLKARALGAFPTLVLWALRDARTPGQILLTLDQWADALTDAANAHGGRDALKQLFVYISNVAENLAFDTFRARVTQLAPAAKEAIMAIAEQLRAQGMKQGREQGREQGLQQGLARGRRESLERLMTFKFGPLPEQVAGRDTGR